MAKCGAAIKYAFGFCNLHLFERKVKMSLCVRNYIRPKILGSLLRYSTSATETAGASEHVIFEDEEETRVREEELERKRNVSRLTPAHFNLVNGRRPYEYPMCSAHKTVKYNRKLYGKYGSTSGVNPSLCWPSKQDIKDTVEFEAVAYPYSIQQMMETVAERRREERLKIQKRDEDVAAKFAKLEQWKKELNDKINKKAMEAQLAKDKKERLVEEVRRHFGFKLDPRDERFQEMLAKREKEQKKADKLARQAAREKVMLGKLQQQNAKLA